MATDIAARGIHVDDVALVIHADPPIEHKAYLHRSGRTARAGASGTVVTLMTDDQVRDVRVLTRAAGITPTTNPVRLGHPLLVTLAPGERQYVAGGATPVPAPALQGRGGGQGRGSSGQGRGSGGGQSRGRSGQRSGPRTGTGAGPGRRSGGQGSGGHQRPSRAKRSGAVRYTTSSSGSGGAAAFSAGRRGR
ncbi:hypothetical protein BH24ACT8_BH24ACT8_22130 [soil metagenome]